MDTAEITVENAVQILHAAKKYMMEDLSGDCMNFIEDNMNEHNCLCLFTNIVDYCDDKVLQMCLDCISDDTALVCQSPFFPKISHYVLLHIVKCDRLEHEAEADLFEACILWAQTKIRNTDGLNEGDARQVLGDCLKHIRFTHIPTDVFVSKFAETNILTNDEKFAIVASKNSDKYAAILEEENFDLASRMMYCRTYASTYSIDSTHATNSEIGISNEQFTLNVGKPIQLMGFSVARTEQELQAEVKIVNVENQETVLEATTSLADLTCSNQNLFFPKTRISPNVPYRIRVHFNDSVAGCRYMYIGRAPCDNREVHTVNFVFSDRQCPRTTPSVQNGNDGCGYIWCILFQRIN